MKAVILQGPPAWTDSEDLEITKYMEQCIQQITEIDTCLSYYRDSYSAEELDDLIQDADLLLGYQIRASNLTEAFYQKHPNLKYISTFAMGFGDFDRALAKKYGVTVTNTVYGSVTIAEYSMALLMEICHGVYQNSLHIKQNDWSDESLRSSYMKAQTPQIELYGKTMGIYGLGNIGLWVAKMASGYGMKVIGSNNYKREEPEYAFIEQVAPDELLSRSDVLSLHLPITSETHHIINDQTLAKMKDGSILLNTARGGLIDEDALCRALHSGKLYAVGLDCLTEEPATRVTPLMQCNNAIITGHIAWYAKSSRMRAIHIGVENLKAYLSGSPVSVLNP